MGRRLEINTNNVEQAAQMEQKGIQDAEKDAMEVSEAKQILEQVPGDVDEDIAAGVEATGEAVRSEGAADMQQNVHATLEGGYDVANDAIAEGTEQTQTSREAAGRFSEAASATEFGSSTAEQSARQAEDIAGQFEANVETAQREMEEAERRYNELLTEIES